MKVRVFVPSLGSRGEDPVFAEATTRFRAFPASGRHCGSLTTSEV